jgi:hypothetical protein
MTFVCNACRAGAHEKCPGGNWCDCLHRSTRHLSFGQIDTVRYRLPKSCRPSTTSQFHSSQDKPTYQRTSLPINPFRLVTPHHSRTLPTCHLIPSLTASTTS